eukprot:TRINITY_DN8536_c0_g2_i1.p1 TRINITY_DN8536_c0_g2~~TRINITY_DN8536_c0_g2_i1.p1  ORF type:complete len:190 (-),score=40.91 TRINITY_DN8536_c0_g2_i1:42-611(-)
MACRASAIGLDKTVISGSLFHSTSHSVKLSAGTSRLPLLRHRERGLQQSATQSRTVLFGLPLKTQGWGKKSTTRKLGGAECALVQKVTAGELDELLLSDRTVPMVVDFYATWCGPCVILAQELEQLALEYGDGVKFVKVDTDEEHELASQLEIRGLPTMVFVSNDKAKNAIRTEGLLPRETIREIIGEL